MAANYTAECAMKCKEPLFMSFLAELSTIPIDAENFASLAVYELCGISSRKQLNIEPLAQKNWQRLKVWFGMWRVGYGKDKPPFKMGNDAYKRGADLEENPFTENGENDPFGPFKSWKSGWLNERSMKQIKSEE